MKLRIEGKQRTTSGSGAPFGQFNLIYGAEGLLHQSVPLPAQDLSITFDDIRGNELALTVAFGSQRDALSLSLGETKTWKGERNILAVELCLAVIE